MRKIIYDDDLHATLGLIGRIGSPDNSQSVSRRSDADDRSSLGDLHPANAGAAAPFNLDQCFTAPWVLP